MASVGPVNFATFSDDNSVGTVAWSFPSQASASDDNKAATLSAANNIETVKIVKAGTVSGGNLAANEALTATDTYYPFGGATNTGGLTLTGADVKSTTFGCVFQVTDAINHSHYLKALNASAGLGAIGDSDTIDGLLFEHEASTNFGQGAVDHIRVTVYYTAAASASAAIPVYMNQYRQRRN